MSDAVQNPLPTWTRYRDPEEFLERLDIAVAELGNVYHGERATPTDERFQNEALAWLYILEEIPTRRLQWCFTRAIRSWESPYPMKASAVLAAYSELGEQLTRGIDPQREDEKRLPGWTQVAKLLPPPNYTVGEPLDPNQIQQWKLLHGLPEEWVLGEKYAECSDLYGKDGESLNRYAAVEEHSDYRILTYIRPENAFRSWKPPWEMYPPPEAAQASRVTLRREQTAPSGYKSVDFYQQDHLWWVDRCVEIAFPGQGYDCPGWVLEHTGPEGEWHKRLACPFHAMRWR
jgi:hypothetical protein